MRDFVYGSNEDFMGLKSELAEIEGSMRVFMCKMPTGCSPDTARIGFEKLGNNYAIYIDRDVQTNIRDMEFVTFLNRKEMRFADYKTLVDFFHSLQHLYGTDVHSHNNYANDREQLEANRSSPVRHVIDVDKVKAEMEQERVENSLNPDMIAAHLKDRIVGQDDAMEVLADIIEIGRSRKKPKLTNVAFLGPTATGKSETGRALAHEMSQLTGMKYGYIECAGNEFVSEQSVHRFLGAPPGYVGYGKDTILSPVRKNPYHIIVINEVEKADERLLVALMEAIDTGYLGMADNSKPINLNNCILIFTSNIKIDMEKYDTLSDYEKTELCMDAFTEHCGRPEISGKISNYVVFKPLSDEANIAIVEKFAIEVFENFDMELEAIDSKLARQFVQYKTSYGARAIRTMVDRVVGRQLLHSGQLESLKHKRVRMKGEIDNIIFEAV